jgi:hypothetical protein
MESFKERCGFDPMATVKHVAIGMKGLGADTPEGIMVLHGLDKAKTMACADKWQAEAAKEKVTLTKDGDVVLAKDESGEGAGFTFISDDRMLVVIGKNVDTAAVKKAAQGGSTLATSPAFVEMYGKINTQVLKNPERTAYSEVKRSPVLKSAAPRLILRRVEITSSSLLISAEFKPIGRHNSRRLQLEQATLMLCASMVSYPFRT